MAYFFNPILAHGVLHAGQGCRMATIISRPNKDGSTSYRIEVVIKNGGSIVHRESKTFKSVGKDSRTAERNAKMWAAKREVELAEPDALTKLKKVDAVMSLAELIALYEAKVYPLKKWGRSKQAVLNSFKRRPEGRDPVTAINQRWLIDFCIKRKVEGASPATVNQDIAFLRSMFSVANGVLGVPISEIPFIEARATLRKLNLVAKSEERDRRPTVQEITDIVALANQNRTGPFGRRRNVAPMDKILVFQMFSGRRISETCRLRWADLDRAKNRVLVRDMKDPGRKVGNDVWVLIPAEAWAVIESMPQVGERIFPVESKSVATNYERLRAKTGNFKLDDDDANLRLHDLRHEALSWLAEKNGLPGENWDIPRIQMVSGHRNWNVLQRYVNLLESDPVDRWAGWEWKSRVLEP